MAGSSEIANHALDLASRYLDAKRGEIARMADGNPNVLLEAAHIVQKRPVTDRAAPLSAEHLAFALITAAFEQLREEAEARARDAKKPPRTSHRA